MRLLWVLLVACTSPRSGVVIDRIDPPQGPSTQRTPVIIEGTNFRLPIVSNVDEGSTIVEEMRVEVGGVALESWSWRNEQLIEGTVPAGMALGPHDVLVRLGRDEAVLPGGYIVSDDAVPGDSGGGGGCAFGPWGTPQAIAELNTSGFDAMPRVSPDELTIYIHSQRAGGSGDRDIWTATRASTTVPWNAPTNVTPLNTAAADRDPSISANGLVIVFSSARSGNLDLYMATRASTAQPFGAPAAIANVNTGSTEYFVWMSPDALTLYWSSTRDGNANIYYSTRPNVGSAFSAPQPRSDVNTAAGEYAPVLSPNGLELYFMSDSGGDSDVYVATRPDVNSSFGARTRIAILSRSGNEDLPASMSPDGRRIYFSSGVVGNSAATYVASRPCM